MSLPQPPPTVREAIRMHRLLLAASVLTRLADPARAAEPVTFNRDVRPILSDLCFTCHGPDKAKRKASLRLDTAEGGKTVVLPGKPADSELFQRITSADPHK